MRKYRKWRDILIEQLAADWEAAFDFIQLAVEEYQVDGDTVVFLLSLRAFVESQGGVAKLAKKTGMDEQVLSEMLSCEKAPRIDMLAPILAALGCQLSIKPLEAENTCAEIGDTDAPVVPIEGTAPNMELPVDNQ